MALDVAKSTSNYFGSSHYWPVNMLMTLYHLYSYPTIGGRKMCYYGNCYQADMVNG